LRLGQEVQILPRQDLRIGRATTPRQSALADCARVAPTSVLRRGGPMWPPFVIPGPHASFTNGWFEEPIPQGVGLVGHAGASDAES
jgi:hypothetical protein